MFVCLQPEQAPGVGPQVAEQEAVSNVETIALGGWRFGNADANA